jgi:Zn-dependent M28 family amino/carboxypeptidase
MREVSLGGIVALGALVLVACQRQTPPVVNPGKPVSIVSDAARRAAATVDATFLADRIKTVSDDSLEGRGPATPGDAKTRAWLIDQLKSLGYEPGGVNGSFEQPLDIVGIDSNMPRQWRFDARGKSLTLKYHDQYVGSGNSQEEQVAFRNAEVVFVGYGIQAPEYQWDDFKGADLKGKVLLMLNSDPDWDANLFAGPTRLFYGRWVYKYESAARQGAVAAIIVHTTPSAGYPFQVVQTSWSGEQFQLPSQGEPRVKLAAWVTEESARTLAALGGQDLPRLVESAKSRSFKPVSLGVQTSLSFTNTVSHKSTANVAGLLRGSDATLANEVVVFTAHHDHLGIGDADKNGDTIYNGAIDNGAGVAQVLGVAKAFKALPAPPRRSVLMLFVAAEEQGLLGSRFYAEHPTFAPGRIAANFNFDGGNVLGRAHDVVYVGKGKSTLDDTIEAIARVQGRIVKGDQLVDRGFFYRSDQFNFARIGVPAFYGDSPSEYIGRPKEWGLQQVEEYEAHRYHQPSDEFDTAWNYEGMIEDLQLNFWAGLAVANADKMPEWKTGDEFEAPRKAALAGLTKEMK